MKSQNLSETPGITDVLLRVHDLKHWNQLETNQSVKKAIDVIKHSQLELKDQINATCLLNIMNEFISLSHLYYDELEELEPILCKEL